MLDRLERESENKKKCSFCKSETHNKDLCEERQRFINLLASDCLKARRTILKRMEVFGLGVGALLSFITMNYDMETHEWSEQRNIGMVVEIAWDHITQLSQPGRRLDHSSALSVQWNDEEEDQRTQKVKLPEIITDFFSDGTVLPSHDVCIISPVKVDIHIVSPRHFLEFRECIEIVRKLISFGYL